MVEIYLFHFVFCFLFWIGNVKKKKKQFHARHVAIGISLLPTSLEATIFPLKSRLLCR